MDESPEIPLAPCNFPMAAVGSHRGNHFKPTLDCILSNIVREGSLLSHSQETHIYVALDIS